VQRLRQAVLDYISKHRLLKAGDRVGVACSGGADSVALVRLLLELRKGIGVVLSLVHFNHKLRGMESDDDERFVAQLAKERKLELFCESGNVAAYGKDKHLSLETAARELRYRYFWRLLAESRMDRIATAHTLDDQAETVLLKLVRGAGTRGLGGVYPQLSVPGSQFSDNSPTIVRPLLGIQRKEIESYLTSIDQTWRQDRSNRDLRHMRNRVRHGILPRLERYLNPGVREALAETAEIARAEEEYWQGEVEHVLPSLWKEAGTEGRALSLPMLLDLPLALQRQVVRAACESLGVQLDFQHVEDILTSGSASTSDGRSMDLRDGWVVSGSKKYLRFERKVDAGESLQYEYRLPAPGSVEVRETKSRFEVLLVSENAAEDYNPEHLLDRSLLTQEWTVRNWRPGDRFWPAHTKAPKKVKELLLERKVVGSSRKAWPVVTVGSQVVWLRDFPSPVRLRPRSGNAVFIREVGLEGLNGS